MKLILGMAMLIEVIYPGGERVVATGYPHQVLVLQIVPRGPEAAYLDDLEVDFTDPTPHRVRRVIGGPRRPTIRVTFPVDTDRDAWSDAREADGWSVYEADDRSGELWIVALRDGLDPADLQRVGGVIVG
ncbi:MAG: hypothetical protein NT062_11860 [Proteobacteria bacterium]|nr:hypothetical protein [Pseudomonadota bacterium]